MTKTYTLKSGKNVKVTAKNKRKSMALLNGVHYAYTILIETDMTDLAFKTTFHDSINNYNKHQGATEDMIDCAVDAIICDYDAYDYNKDLQDFMDEFGYDPEENDGLKAYEACKETYCSLKLIFTDEELQELVELIHKWK